MAREAGVAMNPLIVLLSRIESALRRVYINFRNRRLLSRYVLAQFNLIGGVLRSALGGFWNADQAVRRNIPNNPVLFKADNSELSRINFMLRLAKISVETVPPHSSIDVVVTLPRDCQPGVFATIARCLPRPVNLHFAWSASFADRLIKTTASSGSHSEVASPAPSVREDMVGRLAARQIFANSAREYLKSVDWSSRFCAISARGDDLIHLINLVISKIDTLKGWRFIVLGTDLPPLKNNAGGGVMLVSALDFPTQLALAFESDAYLGDWSAFGVAAVLGNKPAAIRRHAELTTAGLALVEEFDQFDEASVTRQLERLASH
jgi:hypothetical protein